jgi:hypothetical protein
MPAHDWTRVFAGLFHHFHERWLAAISDLLNAGLLPPDYYALQEQTAGDFGPDVLALQVAPAAGGDDKPTSSPEEQGLTSVAVKPPRASIVAQSDLKSYARRKNTIVIRHTSGDDVVALIEIVSPGNKSSRSSFRQFVQKATAVLSEGYHLLLVDVFPPGPRDPQGVHGAIWEEIEDDSYRQPQGKPFTAASYDAGHCATDLRTAYVEPFAVGEALPEMPLFLSHGLYVTVPLETTYQTAYQHVPARWRRVLEGGGPA